MHSAAELDLAGVTSSYCKARCRLSLSLIQAVHQRIFGHLSSRVTTENQWRGFTLMASFKGVLDLVVASHESFRAHAGRPRKRAEADADLLETCATKQIDLRPFRSEPRAVKRRPKSYQLLTEPRGGFREIYHRSRYQKSA